MSSLSEVALGREAGRRALPLGRPWSPSSLGQAQSCLATSVPFRCGSVFLQMSIYLSKCRQCSQCLEPTRDGRAWVHSLCWGILWANRGAALYISFCSWIIESKAVPPTSRPGSEDTVWSRHQSHCRVRRSHRPISAISAGCSETRNQCRRVIHRLRSQLHLFPVLLGDADSNIYLPSFQSIAQGLAQSTGSTNRPA